MDPATPVNASSTSEPTATQVASSLATDAKDQAVHMAHDAKEQIASAVDRRRQDAANTIGQLAGAFLQVAHHLDESGQPTLARSALSVARRTDDVGRYVRDADFAAIAEDIGAAARRHPALFIGASFAGGLLLARFLKSSERHAPEPYDRDLAYAGEV